MRRRRDDITVRILKRKNEMVTFSVWEFTGSRTTQNNPKTRRAYVEDADVTDRLTTEERCSAESMLLGAERVFAEDLAKWSVPAAE